MARNLLAGSRPAILEIALPDRKQGRRDTLEITAPFDGSRLESVPLASKADASSAIDRAFGLFRDRDAWLPVAERIGILERAARRMLRDRVSLATTAALEGGKPLLDSELEVEYAIDALKFCVEHLRNTSQSVIPATGLAATDNRIAFAHFEPVGVSVAFTAFNHPIQLVIHQAAPAIAAGCPVIVKPSTSTPLSCLRVADIFLEAGLPGSWCQTVVAEDPEALDALVSDDRVALFSFTGTAVTGGALRSRLAPGTRCAAGYGANAPVILLDDADHALALDNVVRNAFYHAGQVCVSAQRVFVPKAAAMTFAKEVAERVSALRVGNPRSADTEIGPLIRPSEVDRVDLWVESAVRGGATRLTGGRGPAPAIYLPTVLLDPPGAGSISTGEIAGPVLCVYSYEGLDEAVARINSMPLSAHATVFTSDIDQALDVYRKLDASTVMVNSDSKFPVGGMPSAGIRNSTFSIGSIPQLIDQMRMEKSLVLYPRRAPSGSGQRPSQD